MAQSKVDRQVEETAEALAFGIGRFGWARPGRRTPHLLVLRLQRPGNDGEDRRWIRMVEGQSDHSYTDEPLAPVEGRVHLLRLVNPAQCRAVPPVHLTCGMLIRGRLITIHSMTLSSWSSGPRFRQWHLRHLITKCDGGTRRCVPQLGLPVWMLAAAGTAARCRDRACACETGAGDEGPAGGTAACAGWRAHHAGHGIVGTGNFDRLDAGLAFTDPRRSGAWMGLCPRCRPGGCAV